ncbi:GNAT family N-acetyltransferase [Paenibacillus sp. YPG26]|uniref:GNAT family N-acetyltransferase n=1 Tax=Paenibacillus sp. YPG26 TaxID=2878915 RepID=UPI00204126EA|nr:GNAT family N-acetyltransferase [Paenibacillus sp. YPG26]USB33357.1 GNAT family N-acetyltransferase [Paenibacillus sp. YPG26]
MNNPPAFKAIPMEESHAQVICSWVYPPPYDIYKFPPWERMKSLEIEFGDPQLRREQYLSVLTPAGELAGFAQIFPMEGVSRLGIGMRPDWCGQGLGKSLVQTIVQEALRRYPGHEVDLEVLIWNERAIRTYEKAGFRITDQYELRTPEGKMPFYCMVYHNDKSHPIDET